MTAINYASLAKNGYVIADYPVSDEDFRVGFQQVLSSIKPNTNITPVQKGAHTYFIRSALGYEFGCICADLAQRNAPEEFLKTLEKRTEQYLSGNKGESVGKSSATDLTKIIRDLIEKKEEGENSKIKEIEVDLGIISDSIQGSLEKIVDRENKLSEMMDKSNDLKNWSQSIMHSAKRYNQTSITLKSKLLLGCLLICVYLLCTSGTPIKNADDSYSVLNNLFTKAT